MLRRTTLIAFAGAALAAAPAHAADALGYSAGKDAELQKAAAAGHSHVLYRHSPGGIMATAARTAQFRGQIDRAARGSGFSPAVLEAIVFLESAGRPNVIAGSDPAAASGLAQILAETGRNFLGMRVDLAESRKLTRQIQRAYARGNTARARRLEARRRAVDHRFSPPHALAAMVRYLTKAHGYLGRNDLAIASYHMGIGNLQNALRAYGNARVPYVRLYFDSAPDRNPGAWRVLSSMSDDSRHYYFKVLAAKEVMRLYRTERGRLATLATLHARKLSMEEVMRPSWATPQFQRPQEVQAAWQRGELVPLPQAAGLAYSPSMGQVASRLKRPKKLYRGLRPEAAATLEYVGRRVHQLAGGQGALVVTSSARCYRYQRLLLQHNSAATPGYSLHTTGYAFDIARSYQSPRQAAAFQFVLERLQSRGIIAWIRETGAIHIAVGPRAGVLLQAKKAGKLQGPVAKQKAAKPKKAAKAKPKAAKAKPKAAKPKPKASAAPKAKAPPKGERQAPKAAARQASPPRPARPHRQPAADHHPSPFVRFFSSLRI